MKGRSAVIAPRNIVGTPGQTIKIKRGGTGGTSGAGPTGRKTRPAALLARSLAERAGVAQHVKATQERQRASRLTPPRVVQGLLGAAT